MPLLGNQYSSVDREVIWSALFAHFQSKLKDNFVTMSRRHVMPPELPVEAQPAFFQLQLRERREGSKRGLPNMMVLSGFLIIYLPSPSTGEILGSETLLAATQLNAIYKAIDDALLPDNAQTGKFTIGGLVTECLIAGEIVQDPGIFSDQATAMLPIHLLVP